MNAAIQQAKAMTRRDGLLLFRITYLGRNGKVGVIQDVPQLAGSLRHEVEFNGGTILKEEMV